MGIKYLSKIIKMKSVFAIMALVSNMSAS